MQGISAAKTTTIEVSKMERFDIEGIGDLLTALSKRADYPKAGIQHFLYFLPLEQGHKSFLPGFSFTVILRST